MRGIARQNMEGDSDNEDKSNYMSTTRVNITADLTDDVSAQVMLANERDWSGTVETNGNASDGGNFTVWASNVTLSNFLYSPLTVIVGRQPLRLGNAFVVGDPDTNIASSITLANPDLSMNRSFDAIRAILDYNPLTLNLIIAKVDENEVEASDDQDLYGINATYFVRSVKLNHL